jgi:hypothetical protein
METLYVPYLNAVRTLIEVEVIQSDHLSFFHALMKFKDIDKIKLAISETL